MREAQDRSDHPESEVSAAFNRGAGRVFEQLADAAGDQVARGAVAFALNQMGLPGDIVAGPIVDAVRGGHRYADQPQIEEPPDEGLM